MSRHGALSFLVAVMAVLAAAALAAAVPATAFQHRGDDWAHAKSVVERLAERPPDGPVVYLLGGSSARECTVDDADWSAQIRRLGAHGVHAYDLGAASQSYAQDIWLLGKAPDVPTLVLIGVNVGRYTPPYRAPVTPAPSAAVAARAARAAWDQHSFHRQPLADWTKAALVGKWLRERYPIFKRRYAEHAAVLPELVAACLDRGFRPVIVELPLNLAIVGHAWDVPRQRYAADCRRVAAKYDIPYVDFVGDIHLVSSDFYDLAHLIEPGRVKWQQHLSHLVVRRLHQYHLDTTT